MRTLHALQSLRSRFLLLVGGIYLAVGALAALLFLQVTRGIIHRLGADYAVQYAIRQRGNILAKVDRELVLAQKLADSSVLRRWSLDEGDLTLTSLALEELESFRRLFADRSVFFVVDASRHYYFNSAGTGERPRLQYTIEEGDPTTAWYFDTMTRVSEFALHVDNSAQLGLTKIWINAVIRDGNRKVALGGTGLDLTQFLRDSVRSTAPGVETILLDGAGFVQGHSDVALMEKNARIRDESKRLRVSDLLTTDTDRALLSDRLARLSSGVSTTESFEIAVGARRVLAAATYMEKIDWAALILVDPSQVIHFRQFVPILALFAAALLATILLVSWSLDKLVLARLARLTASTGEVAAGRYDMAPSADRPDEIGNLTQSFNHMAATILGHTQELEDRVEERTQELRASNELLDASNRKMTDSIRLACLIQGSLLPRPADFSSLLPEWFVLFRPRDVVGGDFYALYRGGDAGFLVAVADCTGHGVPGAFMTMAAKALLDRAVAEHGVGDPAVILTALDGSMRALLSREGQGGRHGLDIALVLVRPESRAVRFASARLPLWIQSAEGSFCIVPGEHQSLGYADSSPASVFANTDVAVATSDRLFLLTDGILDQAMGPQRFGLGRRRLQEALACWKNEPMSRIEGLLEMFLRPQGDGDPQRDDVTLLGFRVGSCAGREGEA